MSAADGLIMRAGRKLRRMGAAALASPLAPGGAVTVKDIRQPLPAIGQRLSRPYFVGRYDTMAGANAGGGNPYDTAPWVETAEFATQSLLARLKSPNFIIDSHLLPFATLIAAVGMRKERVRVLDFGGGLGDNFLHLEAVLDGALKSRIDYHIVDTPKNCVAGRALLAPFADRLHFHSADPDHGGHYDFSAGGDYHVTMLCGTLMYIDTWQALLGELATKTSDHLYITRTPANASTPTFYVKQLIAPGAGPWAGKYIGSVGMAVINPGEIRDLLARSGFRQDFFATLFAYGPEMTLSPAPYNAIVQAMTIFSKS